MRDEINEPLGQARAEIHAAARLRPACAGGLALIGARRGLAAPGYWRPRRSDSAAPLAVARIETRAAGRLPPPASNAAAVMAASPHYDRRAGREGERRQSDAQRRRRSAATRSSSTCRRRSASGWRPRPIRGSSRNRNSACCRASAPTARGPPTSTRGRSSNRRSCAARRAVAILVGGLGIDAASTSAAIDELPSAVSLGFAPYGDGLRRDSRRARARRGPRNPAAGADGGFGAPAPGPHTLTTAASEAENRESLQWMMARFPGFVGVDELSRRQVHRRYHALSRPCWPRSASRGLLYLDDGSSPRSLAGALAPGINLRARARPTSSSTPTPTPEAIEMALAKLETLARRQDGAIGVATALPRQPRPYRALGARRWRRAASR